MRRTIFAAVFLVCLNVLIFELSAVRLFSVLFRYHYVFAVVSFGILGIGLGALLAGWRKTDHVLVWTALGCGLLQPLTLAAILVLPIPAGLWSVCGLLLPPFVLAGWFLAAVFARWPEHSGRLYCADLCGAATGCLLSLGLMNLTGPINALLIGAIIATVAGLLVSRAHTLAAVTAAGILGLTLAGNLMFPFANLERVRLLGDATTTKPMWRQLRQYTGQSKILVTAWDAFTRTDVVSSPDPDVRWVFTDGDTPTQLFRAPGRYSAPDFLRGMLGYVPYHVWPGRANDRLLCIGAGGGLDVQLGQLAGIREIVAVDVNRALPAILAESRAYHGGIYDQAGTVLHVAEGRQFLRRQRAPFDVIYLALTQTASAGGSGLALTESYIHTVDAFVDALRCLTPDGRLVLVFEQEASLQRGFLTVLEALQQVPDTGSSVAQHVVAFSRPDDEYAPYNHLLIAKRSPLTPMEIVTLQHIATQQRLRVQFLPTLPAVDPLVAAITTSPLNLIPVRDDNPFFFDLTFGVPAATVGLICIAGLATLVLVIWAVAASPAAGITAGFGPLGGLAVLLGVGFMIVQNVAAQRLVLLLGHPTLALAVTIFAMLVGGGAGSFAAQRWADAGRLRSLVRLAGWVIPALVLTNYALPPVLQLVVASSPLVHIGLVLGWVMPVGFLMGLFFPTALRLAAGTGHPGAVPLLWAINGTASVLGGALTIALAKLTGFSLALNVATVSYAIAVLLLGYLVARQPQDSSLRSE